MFPTAQTVNELIELSVALAIGLNQLKSLIMNVESEKTETKNFHWKNFLSMGEVR